MTKIGVVHLTSAHSAWDTRILRRECVALAGHGKFAVTLLNAKGEDFEYKGVNVESVDRARGRVGRLLLSVPKSIIAVLRRRERIIHIHDPELLPLVPFMKFAGRMVIFDCHEDFTKKIDSRPWIPRIFRPLVRFGFRLCLSVSLRNIAAVVAATPEIGHRLGHPVTVVVRNMPDASVIAPPSSSTRRRDRVILYTGGLTPNRGISEVVEALRTWSEESWKLIIVGRKNENVARHLRAALKDRRIEYLGVIEFEKVVELMQEAQVGVVCNQKGHGYESALPNKLFEYMAAGLGVVASDFPEWESIVRASGAGVVCDPSSPQAIQRALARFLGDKTTARTAGKRGRKLVEEKFNWAEESRGLIALYGKLMAGGPEAQR